MKKYLSIFIAGLIALSCNDLLDVDAENTISGDVFVSTESVQAVLNGAYFTFNGISDGGTGGELMGGDFVVISELLSRYSNLSGTQEYRWEAVNAASDYRDFRFKDIQTSNSVVEANWLKAFETIQTTNRILDNLDVIDDASERNRIQGESLAIRGILLYEMILLWAPQYTAATANPSKLIMPFSTDPIYTVDDIPTISASSDLKSLEQLYDQAEGDLELASVLLKPFGKNDINLSYYACQGYLAKLHLQKGESLLAFQYADTVINSGEYALTNPLDAFNNPSNSSQDIYAIQQNTVNNVGDRSSGFGIYTYFSSLNESGLGVYRYLTLALYDEVRWWNAPGYDDLDVRGTIYTNTDENTTSAEIDKAWYTSITDNDESIVSSSKYLSPANVLPVLRLAEMYLIRAEALINLNGIDDQAIADINETRTRAGLAPLQRSTFDNDPDGEGADRLFEEMALERTREFILEGHLLEDLKRWDWEIGTQFGSTQFLATEDRVILPIPLLEQRTWVD